MHCFSCNAVTALAAGERVGFRDCCDHCGADLHACRNCVYHEPSSYNECREPNTERVADRERANRCEYFSPSSEEGGSSDGRSQSLSALDELFKK
jgi:hypothetical protein